MAVMKRRLKWIAALFVILLLAAGSALLLLPRDRVTQASWKRIHVGMSEVEAENILGGPGISFSDAAAAIRAMEERMNSVPFIVDSNLLEGDYIQIFETRVWLGRRGAIGIQFKEGCVSSKFFQGWRPTDPTFIERVRDWLGW